MNDEQEGGSDNRSLRSIVRIDSGETYREMLTFGVPAPNNARIRMPRL